MLVSVAICTWNRADLLDRTLESLRRLAIPEGVQWELLVVNNNCTDATDATLARYQPYLPLRQLFEPKQGHSHARNCALEAAHGELILWTDDDVLVGPDWLAEHVRVANLFPDAVFFGGTVMPWFETPPPRWLRRSWSLLHGWYAVRELGEEVRPFREEEVPYGANLGFRTAVLRQFRFDPERGHKAGQAIGGEETAIIRQMRAMGHRGVWVGTARVEHFIAAQRMTRRYVWDYARRLQAQEPPPAVNGQKLWVGVPRWLWRQYLTSRVRSGWAALWGRPDWAGHILRAARLRAQIDWYLSRERAAASKL